MPRYMVTRTLPPLDPDQLRAVACSVLDACDQLSGTTWITSHVTADGKHSFCEFEAPDADACRQHAALAGLPVDDVVPLGQVLLPVSFP